MGNRTKARAFRNGLQRGVLFALVSLVCGLVHTQAHGADPEPLSGSDPFRNQFHKGSKQVALLGGYGIGFRMGKRANRRISRELKFVRPVELVPRIGIGVTDPLGGESWYRGNVEMLFEGALLFNTEPRFGFAGGVGTTLRYNFLRGSRFIPYLDGNFGVLGVDFDLERQANGFNFNVGAGVGSHWFIGDRTAVSVEARWQHISNAGTKQENDGINAALFLFGFTVFLD